MPTGLEMLIGGMFASVLGTPLMMGLFGLLILLIIGVLARLSMEGFLVVFMPYFILTGTYGYLPLALAYGAAMICGFIIFMAIMGVVRR